MIIVITIRWIKIISAMMMRVNQTCAIKMTITLKNGREIENKINWSKDE